MAIVRGFNPVWSFVDLDGNQCDGSFYLWVLENQIPYIPATVYHDAAGTLPWNSPIQLLANGTLPIDIYWDDTQVYRLELRKNLGIAPPSQADPLIYLIENYVPDGSPAITPTTNSNVDTDNQITNGQFSIVNFSGTTTFSGTNPDPIEIAPGWFLELAGTGTITVERSALNNSSINPTNAPYALHLVPGGGWTSVKLRQRFQQNGMLWALKNVATSVTARVIGAPQNISARLVASNGGTVATLLNATLTNNFVEYTGFATLPATMNANTPPNAYIDYVLTLPTSADFYITSFQVAQTATPGAIPYQQDTIDRQIDHTFHYYKDPLIAKPIPSYLIGWDFPLNPAQINSSTLAAQAVGANKSYYAWDQTIIFQTANSALTIARSASGNGLQLTAAQAGSFAVIQYLDEAQARELLSGRMAAYVEGFASLGFTGTVSLWATSDVSLPDLKTPNFNSLVSAVSATGVVTAANGSWTKVGRGSYSDPTFDLTTSNQAFTFNGWSLTGALQTTATYFAIVISFESAAIADVITLNRIGLYSGDIATRPAPETVDAVQRKCERFYEKSLASQTLAAAANTLVNAITSPAQYVLNANPSAANTATGVPQNFGIQFKTEKRIAPTITVYSPITAAASKVNAAVLVNNVSGGNTDENITSWTQTGLGTKSVYYLANNTTLAANSAYTAFQPVSAYINFHYIADARLGIVL